MAEIYLPDGTKLSDLKDYGIRIVATNPATSKGEGELIYNTTDDNVYKNTGTAATPNWIALSGGGGGVWGSITGTLSNQADLQNALNAKLDIAGSIGSITTRDHHLLTGLGDDDHTQYLLLTAGDTRALSGNLYITKTTPALYLREGGVTQAVLRYQSTFNVLLQAATEHLELNANTAGKSILLETSGVARLTVADALLTSSVPLAMSSQKITGLAAGTVAGDALRYEQLVGVYLPLAGGTMAGNILMNNNILDFKTDSVHKIFYGGVTPNDLVYSTYNKHRFYTTFDAATQLEITDSATVVYADLVAKYAIFFKKNYTGAGCYIVDDVNGVMEFHVPAGQKFKFTVG